MLPLVGIRTALRLAARSAQLVPDVTASTAEQVATVPGVIRGVRSPWTEGTFSQLVWADLLDAELMPVTRAEAMTVPSVVKARHLIVTHLAGVPLRAMRGPDVLPADAQPTFLYRTNGASTPWHRMAWTLDDLLFHGWSLWRAVRGADGAILDAVRVPPEWWRITPDNDIEVQGEVVPSSSVILFAGPSEGLLEYAARTIRAARNVEQAWAGRVRNPAPIVELHQVSDDELTDDEVDDIIDAYTKARQDPNGAVVFTPPEIELRVHGDPAGSQMVEARNAVRLDVANLTGLPAEALDGSLSTASLTYTTQEGTRSELADALRMWFEPIEARLSQDDVVPRGQRVRFDRGDLAAPVPSPTGPTVED